MVEYTECLQFGESLGDSQSNQFLSFKVLFAGLKLSFGLPRCQPTATAGGSFPVRGARGRR